MASGRALRIRLFLYAFLPYAIGALNVLSTLPEGIVFSFTKHQHTQYLVSSQPAVTITPLSNPKLPFQLTPATSIWIKDALITKDILQAQLSLYTKVDDVWNANFLENVVIYNQEHTTAKLNGQTYDWLKSAGVAKVYLVGSIDSPPRESIPTFRLPETLPPGPLALWRPKKGYHGLRLHNVYRLYLDEYESFLFGTIPDVNGGWISTNISSTVPSADDGPDIQLIPVPSRLIMLSADEKQPLIGTRFGLKDIYDAKGLPTAAGSHAYAQTHPIPNSTAPSVMKLLDLGAVMVGKTRTSQFAHGAQPWEFVDVPYSWNPRGDGYLTASASSSGSACAIAGYDWVDFTVGSDTRGSVRKPAALVGCYGIRPSHGSMDLTGVVPLSEEMDTAGFFARHPSIFYEVATKWYADSPVSRKEPSTHFPANLFYPVDQFPMKNKGAQVIVENFIQSVNFHLGMMVLPVNFTAILAPFFPNNSFPAFQVLCNRLSEYRSWMDVGKPTVAEFISRYGVEPSFDPVPQRMFAKARNTTAEEFEDAVAAKRAFRDSISHFIFRHEEESCSDSIFMYDAATGGVPSYRVEEFNYLEGAVPFVLTAPGVDKEAQASDYFTFLASMGELPEVTLPIGEVNYFSPLTRAWEPIPIAIQLVSRKGCDGMLLDLVKRLADVGVVQPVQVGRFMYPSVEQ